jgi:peptidyl-prolyl cis-trans isomerase SurA
MKRFIWINLVILALFSNTFAQPKEEILFSVGNESVSKAEFERIYLKNNQMVEESDRKSIEEYFDLFVIYKLKVAEAKAQGLHNSESFKQELNGYRKQLVQPYFIDKDTEQRIIKQAYERMKYEINASHILIAVPENASPADTARLFDKIIKIRERILKGESFDAVARATSDDPSVKNNGGMLGYFTAFQMVYPFENAVYNTPVGQISMPIRTQFGYHIVKVNDKRENVGQVKTSHIMIATPPNATADQKKNAKAKIDSIYKVVINNESFADLAAKYSHDQGSAKNGGELPWFGTGRMVPEFEKAAFAIQKVGDVSKPIQTQFGWHIIKLNERKTIGSFEETLPEITNKLSRDERGRLSKSVFIDRLKAKNNFKLDSTALYTMVGILDSSVYKGNWSMPSRHKNKVLFTFAGKQHTLDELGTRISSTKLRLTNIPFHSIVERFYNDLVEETIYNYEENRMINENSDFYYLMKEYHDGILLFEIMDQNVWTKAIQDDEGLENFFRNNSQNYLWEKRVHLNLYIAKNEKVAKSALKLASSRKGKKLSTENFLKRFNKKSDTLLQINHFATLPENPIIKGFEQWKNALSTINSTEKGYEFMQFIEIKKNEPKTLDEVRGQAIADYQEYLEKEWLKLLREKHTVKINKEVFEKVLSNLN